MRDKLIFFVWNVNLGLEVLTDIRDFTTLLFVIPPKWLESSIESDLSVRLSRRSFDLDYHDFSFFKALFLV